jgi:two-component system chemotaxis sensor kinase CheA
MDDLVGEFLMETNEGLEALDQDMVDLEQNPNDKELLGKIFRLMHTIKGTCGFIGLPRLERVAHHAENVLGRFRDGDLEVIPEYVTLIFDSLDRIKVIVKGIADTGSEPEGDDSQIIAQLDAAYEGKSPSVSVSVSVSVSAPLPPPIVEKEPVTFKNAQGGELRTGEVSPEELEAVFAATAPLPLEQLIEMDVSLREGEGATPSHDAKTASAPQKTAGKQKDDEPSKAAAPVVTQETLRVGVDVLEDLMTMVSELVLTRNQLLQILRADSNSDFGTPLQRLNQIVSELQEGVMKTRMQPIGNAWSKLPRIIRDLSIELGKKIDLQMEGKDTELDRQVLELIKDPLTHMVRNSADHAIEKPAERIAAGKPETGRVLLEAYHEGGHIIINIADDGKGLSTEKIKSKIISNGLASEADLAEMTTQQIQQFIFKAGFSTAEKVTAVSGRGVGMDVVRTNIEKIGGSIELVSVEGKGSTFTIKIPLTLAIVSALIIESAGERFAIPQLSVRELVMTSAQGDTQIEVINDTPVFRLRNKLLPLVPLNKLLKLGKSKQGANVPHEPDPLSIDDVEAWRHKYIIVAQVGLYQFGIVVDKVFDTEEIVVKPVSKILRHIDIFSGNTILGDGSVVMILDPNGIARMTGEIETVDSMSDKSHADAMHSDNKKMSLLLFNTGNRTPKAVPLALVARLEQVQGSTIEYSGDQMVVQYRGQLMSLVPFDGNVSIDENVEYPVIVFSDRGKSLGLIITEIVDICESAVDIQHSAAKPGIIGSAVINGHATDVVDVGYYLKEHNDNWFADHDPNVAFEDVGSESLNELRTNGQRVSRRRVLLVDDSPFFRNMLTPLLTIAGYDVTPLDRAQAALDMCDDGREFDVIISDIEMPDINGFEFAERVKANSNWQNIPMVALSSHATDKDIERGKEVGFSQYVAKFDREKLLTTISETLSSGGRS